MNLTFQTIYRWDEQVWKQAELIYQQAFPEHGRKPTRIIHRLFDNRLCQLHVAIRTGGSNEPYDGAQAPENGRDDGVQASGHEQCDFAPAAESDEIVAIALSGNLEGIKALLIDYIAVRKDVRNRGIGEEFIGQIKRWARTERHLDGILVEVEAGPLDGTDAEHNVEQGRQGGGQGVVGSGHDDDFETKEKRHRFWKKCGFELTDYVHKYVWVPELYQAMYCNLGKGNKMPTDGRVLFQYITHFHKVSYRGGTYGPT